MYAYLEIGAPGCQQRIERCSVLTAKSLIEQIENNSSQAVGVTLETFTLSLPLNYHWWNDATYMYVHVNTQETASWAKPRAKTGRDNKMRTKCHCFLPVQPQLVEF